MGEGLKNWVYGFNHMRLKGYIFGVLALVTLDGCIVPKKKPLIKPVTVRKAKRIKTVVAIPQEKIAKLAGSGSKLSLVGALDNDDKEIVTRTVQEALERGHPLHWENPSSGNHGSVKSISDSTKDCRTYVHSLTVGDETEVAAERACRQPDGTWTI
jgi:surface antigen